MFTEVWFTFRQIRVRVPETVDVYLGMGRIIQSARVVLCTGVDWVRGPSTAVPVGAETRCS